MNLLLLILEEIKNGSCDKKIKEEYGLIGLEIKTIIENILKKTKIGIDQIIIKNNDFDLKDIEQCFQKIPINIKKNKILISEEGIEIVPPSLF